MNEDIVNEINRRFNIMVNNIDVNDSQISFGRSGSFIRFCEGLCLIGYATRPSGWMDDEYKKECMSVEEFHSDEYDHLLDVLHNKLLGMQK